MKDRPDEPAPRSEGIQDTRRRITAAAVELHGSVGPARTTISDIARIAGVDRVTVYRHFPDEAALLRACSAKFAAEHPMPDPARWTGIPDPARRLRAALRALYRYYAENETILTNVTRDAETIPALGEVGGSRREWLAAVELALVRGWSGHRPSVSAAIALALDFRTWRKLTRERRLTDEATIALLVAMVGGAATPAGRRRATPEDASGRPASRPCRAAPAEKNRLPGRA